MPENEKANRSATLAKGLAILDVIDASPTPMRLQEIMTAQNLTKPTAHRLLSTLVDFGLVRYEPKTTQYQLGMRLFEMSRRVWDDFDLRGTSAAELKNLNELTGEATALALLVGNEAVYVDEIASNHHIQLRASIGRQVPLLTTAIGKALMAGMPYSARQLLLSELVELMDDTPEQPTLLERAAQLDLVNARGYAIETEEHISGVVGVAAPIVDHRGITVAAIGLTGPSSRLSREKLHDLGPALIETTRRTSLQAGGVPRSVSNAQQPKKKPNSGVATLVNSRNLIGESPVHDRKNNRLFWVDICRPAIYRFELSDATLHTISPGEMVTAVDLVPSGLLIAAQSGLRIIDPVTGDTISLLGHPEIHIPTNRFNDGRCDSHGRFWVGTLALNLKSNAGALYKVETNGSFETMETGLTLPNGIGWSPDNKIMYLVDTSDRSIYQYDFDEESGVIANRNVLVAFSENIPGNPDGLAVDSSGDLWVAMWDGWRICQYSPEGHLKNEVILPIPRPTSCVFGGENNTLLFVTSARIRISEKTLNSAPLSGAVFSFDTVEIQ